MKSPADYVDPTIDTANRRFFFFSSACRPFGMVNLSPDTVQNGTWGSGYRYNEPYVLWFSHVHAWQLAGIPVLPVSGPCRGPEGAEVYKSIFSHESEMVTPGYHALTLEDYAIRAELTATDRVGFHRYTFTREGESHVLFDLSAEVGPSQMAGFHVERSGDSELSGYVVNAPTVRRPKATRIYFVVHVDQPWDSFNSWSDHGITENITTHHSSGGVFLSYHFDKQTTLQLKVAISYCSVDQARNNLTAELPHWDFEQVRSESRAVWNRWLGRITVRGGTEARRVKFYTDLYHALLGRRKNSDVSGTWSDMTGDEQVIRSIPLNKEGRPAYEHHNSDAFWGAQWNINLLWSIAYPEIVHNFCNTFVDFYKHGGLIPRGPSGGNYTFVMVSPSSTHLFASAYQKGIRTFDVEAAYEGLVKNHEPGGLISKAGYEHKAAIGGGAEYYIDRGYVPLGIEAAAYHLQGAGQTLEYAFCDWALGQLATALGKDKDARNYLKRSENYRNLFNKETGFFQPRTMDGSWLEPFDPMAPDGWVEGNGWHYLWHVPHNVSGLIALMGGREPFTERLNEVFRLAEPEKFTVPPGNVHHLNYIEYGNQPSLYTAHLFSYAGAPWLTQKWVRRIMEVAKRDITPYGGYSGDEDQGEMGALNVLMAIGLFNVSGGSDRIPYYEITSPVFEEVTITLDPSYCEGETFIIRTNGVSEDAVYIQSAKLNGEPINRSWITHAELCAGGVLELTLGTEPNYAWGSAPGDSPPPAQSK
jgi:predicted alpha-1,2-mannosidase